MDAVLVINKPKGLTSRDVINQICKKFNTKKVGHTGTLDPLATGVLIICIGKYTKLVDLLTSDYKEYVASFVLGYQTDTYDITGEKINESNKEVTEKDIKKVIRNFPKKYNQEVPIYSAVKVNGKKLYEYARNNMEVSLPKKEVEIKELKYCHTKNNKIVIDTIVSKGTYIRSLINDIGIMLDTYATMNSLVRIKVGNISLEDSYSLEDVLNDNYEFYDIKKIFDKYQKIKLNDDKYQKVLNGSLLPRESEDLILYIYKNEYIVIYKPYEKDKKLAKPYIWLN